MKSISDLMMYKEIHETKDSLINLINKYTLNSQYNFDLEMIERLKRADQIIFIACGTSYHACRFGVDFFTRSGKMASAYIASEWAYNPVVYGKNPVFIVLSQSGETGDILACKFFKNDLVIAITNNLNSSIDKKATYSLPLDCKEEVGIAATKSFSCQYVLLYLLASAIIDKTIAINDVKRLIDNIDKIYDLEDNISTISEILVPRNRAFILGRGLDYISATEGSLKIKETSYIFAEPYASGEFKHGYIALVDFGVPVIGLLSSSSTAKLFRKNISDVKSKGGEIIMISSSRLAIKDDQIITPSVNESLDPLLQIIALQLLACFLSYKKGLNVDSPRSLVKSVHGE